MGFMRRERVLEGEVMDSGALSREQLATALRGLHRLNRISFVAGTVSSVISRWARATTRTAVTVLDIACSDGRLLRDVVAKMRPHGIAARGVGLDINPLSIAIANELAASGDGCRFEVGDALAGRFPEADVIYSTLFLHHLSGEDAVTFIRSLHESGAQLVVIHDLKRTFTGKLLAYLAPRIFSRSYAVREDGERSIRAAFTPGEVREMLREAGVRNYEITDTWPSRMLITWSPDPIR